MTYKELAALINDTPESHQSLDVTIYCDNCDEWYPAAEVKHSKLGMALDHTHPYITLNTASNCMTYKELAASINNMSDDHQSCCVAVYCHNCEEHYPAADVKYTNDSQDVLDTNHPFITLEENRNEKYF